MSENQHARQSGTARAALSSPDGGVEALPAFQTGGLVDFYAVFCPQRFPSAKTRRAKQNLAKKLKLPLIRAGQNTLVDPRMADDRLRELALYQEREEPPRRGRPRLIR
jgi:hypothetical protein